MTVSCSRFDRPTAGVRVRVAPAATASPLVHGVRLAGGVHVAVDLTAPTRWYAVSSAGPGAVASSVLDALTGDVPAGGIGPVGPERALDPPGTAAPWLRVVIVDALNQWLQTPLAQYLVDAERGVVRGRAARTLPHGPARAALTAEALRLARRSSRDLVALLRRLRRNPRPVPASLSSALVDVVDGYAELAGDVVGPDRDLQSVIDGWRRLARRPVSERDAEATPPTSERSPMRPSPRLALALNAIDPRQVRARLLALSPDPATPEVALSPASIADAVVVRVATFGPDVDPDAAARLWVRLVDRRSAEPRGHALLRASEGDASCLEATVPLYGLDVADVRADVADVGSDLAPAADDADDDLCAARRATVFLAEWRRIAGLAQLGVAAAAPARRLRRLTARLQPTPAHEPLFPGGPMAADLEALAALGDEALSRRLRGDGVVGDALWTLTAGSAGLLVAEVAALLLSTPR